MRPQSETILTVGSRQLGGTMPLICLPLVAKNTEDLLHQAATVKEFSPDLYEWRIDAFEHLDNIDNCIDALQQLQKAMAPIPVIFTCRTHLEGGLTTISQQLRRELITAALDTGLIDIVDIELCNEASFVDHIKTQAQKSNTHLILSYHNFTETPEESFIANKLVTAVERGADIPKVAVMPHNYGDVLTLLNATFTARSELVKLPMVTMSMGREGAMTRVTGGLFGSDITFAIGAESSAPGQIPIALLKDAMAALY